MKKLVLSILTAVAAITGAHAQTYLVDTLRLNNAERALIADQGNPAIQREFFDAFPANWFEFYTTYFYPSTQSFRQIPEDFKNPMYDHGCSQADLFGNLNSIPDTVYVPRIMDIATGMIYDADAPNFFQNTLHKAMDQRGDAMMEMLSQISAGDQLRFWQFFFETQTLGRENYDCYKSLVERFGKQYPDEMETAKTAFVYMWGNGGDPYPKRRWPNAQAKSSLPDCECHSINTETIKQMTKDGFTCDKPWLQIPIQDKQ